MPNRIAGSIPARMIFIQSSPRGLCNKEEIKSEKAVFMESRNMKIKNPLKKLNETP